MTKIHFAPLQGYADHLYRRFHAEIYGPADFYYTPFIRMEGGVPRRQDLSRLEQSKSDGTNLVPQVIFRSADEFSSLVSAIKELGYSHIDINLGCPYTMQTRKGRGAAMLGNIQVMSQVSGLINDDAETEYSVKMRLGRDNPGEWRNLMSLLNGTRLSYITVHPRVATQMYGGELHAQEFKNFLEESEHPVLWNGDVKSIEDIRRIEEEYPGIGGIMIGRGLLARPSLVSEWKNGCEWRLEERMSRLAEFHRKLFAGYSDTLCGQAQVLQKIKSFWEYLESTIGHKAAKSIRKATSVDRYIKAVNDVFSAM